MLLLDVGDTPVVLVTIYAGYDLQCRSVVVVGVNTRLPVIYVWCVRFW